MKSAPANINANEIQLWSIFSENRFSEFTTFIKFGEYINHFY